MNITFHSPILITDKLEELKKFYIEQLGLEIDMDFGPCVSLKCGLSLWQLSPEHKIAKSSADNTIKMAIRILSYRLKQTISKMW
jgi:hypothetical protein